MKIEIGESLISSYLNHIEQCRIIQTNWKVSGNWSFGEYDMIKAKHLFDRIKENELFVSIFKESSFEQLIKQSEIDVLGINTVESTVYAYDIAFHSMGLNYGGNIETCQRIAKKLFRAIFTLQIYFPEFDRIESFFVTPKVNNKLDELLKIYILEAKKIITDSSITIGYLANHDFFSEIVDQVVHLSKNENDTSELFLRALKLYQLDDRLNYTSKKSDHTAQIPDNSKRTKDGMKIGQYVKNSLFTLTSKGLLSKVQIADLQNSEYCKTTFKIGFPVLLNSSKSKTDDKGYIRYYKDEVVKGYWLCSQWNEVHWDLFLKWEEEHRA